MTERQNDRQPATAATGDETQRASLATAEAQKEAEAKRLDEVPEGQPSAVYIVGGIKVGPHGRPIQEDGREAPPPPRTEEV